MRYFFCKLIAAEAMIENAIKLSINFSGRLTNPNVAKPNVIECAIVNAVTTFKAKISASLVPRMGCGFSGVGAATSCLHNSKPGNSKVSKNSK